MGDNVVLTFTQYSLLIGTVVELCMALVLSIVLSSALAESDPHARTKCDRLIFAQMGDVLVMLVTHIAANFLRYFRKGDILFDILQFVTYVLGGIAILIFQAYLGAYRNSGADSSMTRVHVEGALFALFAIFRIVAVYFGHLYTVDNEVCSLVYNKIAAVSQLPLASFMCFNISYVLYRHKRFSGRDFKLLLLYSAVPPALASLQKPLGAVPVYIGMAISAIMIYLVVHEERNKLDIEESRELMKHRAELANNRSRLALSQIKPHFLYNSLNTIYYLCDTDPKTAQKALADLSDYLRMNLDALGREEYVTFDTELKHIETYLALEKLRFEDELTIEYDIEVTNFCVPVLSVQPLVENAVKHGVGPKIGGGTVKIITRENGDYYEVIVEDDGMGFNVDSPREDDGRSHVGVDSVRQRLDTMCEGELIIDSREDVGTRATIRIPKDISGREIKI